MKILYFTSTGNCLAVAKRFDAELVSIPQALKNKLFEFEDEVIGIIYPCYYLGTPCIVQDFMAKANLKAGYIFAIMTYGNFAGGGVHHFEAVAKKSAIKISYLNDLLMVDNYLPIFDVDKQLAKEPQKNIEENLSKIISDINDRKVYIKKVSLFRKLLSSIALFVCDKFVSGKVDKKFRIGDNCNGCGVCAQVCPVDNIKVDGKPEYLHHCIECLGCIHQCPQRAIHVKGEKNTSRFINREVKLKEIIDANK